jgi:UDP-N-acetylmuramate: L-alanyl-gamma-D-glutamyl-meso-diaminopimelate ligase
MGGLAILAKQLGHQVSGSDQNVYPPMSTQLEEQGISLLTGFSAENLVPEPDLVIVGNSISRGNPEIEAVMNMNLPYVSGPQWLYEHVLRDKWILGVAGTHGKTTTSSMLTWILEKSGLEPGFLIGGIPLDFKVSARLGGGRFFVVEADEYDTAFFDKRSKFVHYHPKTIILNNLEFDHADIFPDLSAIKRQFHHLVRCIPGNGLIITPEAEHNITDVLNMGCWTPVALTGGKAGSADWQYELLKPDGSEFEVFHKGVNAAKVEWNLIGLHNVNNAMASIAAAHHAGIEIKTAAAALGSFQSVKRRLEVISSVNGITLYDDFAHHPTAIKLTLEGLRARVGNSRIIAVLEPRSNTMKMGVHSDQLADSLSAADLAIIYQAPDLGWDTEAVALGSKHISICKSLEGILEQIKNKANHGDHVVFMSNGSFGGIHQKAASMISS